MNTLARISALVLIVLGILILLAGLLVGTADSFRLGARLVGTFPSGLRPGYGLWGGLALGVFLFVQGFLITAAGEGLYLLSGLAAGLRSS